MGLIPAFIGRLFAPPAAGQRAVMPLVRARYDAERDAADNSKHWANADDYSANAANSPGVRRKLRRRARYERANNSYLNGLVKTIAHDLIGTGPRLQLSLPAAGVDRRSMGDSLATDAQGRQVERAFAAWAMSVELADKLRVMTEAKLTDGEGFGVFFTNPVIPGPVKLDMRLIEAEQVSTPMPAFDPRHIDGMEFDDRGNVLAYHVLKQHPGDFARTAAPWEYDTMPAASVVHWFRADRPGQARGVPEFASALPLGAYLRRYTLAVIAAAETAANLAGVMTTNMPATDGEPVAVESMDEIQMPRNTLLTLPNGWDAKPFTAEQPTGTYKEFKGEILNEMGRCLGAPFNVIAGNSSGYNYSSGRLDHQIYHRTLWIERERMRHRVLDKLFRAWLAEYLLIPPEAGGSPAGLPPVEAWAWEWQWDGFASIDPVKDTAATEAKLRLGLTTRAEECAAEGRDWREVVRQRAAEMAEFTRLGVPEGTEQPAGGVAAGGPGDGEQSSGGKSANV